MKIVLGLLRRVRKLGRIIVVMTRGFEVGHSLDGAFRNALRVAQLREIPPHSIGDLLAIALLIAFVLSTIDALVHAFQAARKLVKKEDEQ